MAKYEKGLQKGVVRGAIIMTLFVTVGNGRFDPLIKEVDRLVREGIIREKVVAQIGHGRYKPEHCTWFTFEGNLDKYYENAALIIGHGGPGTVFEILRKGKKLIAIPNRDRTDPRHQVEYLEAMARETGAMLYCPSVAHLKATIIAARQHHFVRYVQPPCEMHTLIRNFLRG